MEGNLESVGQLYMWNYRILSFGGVWPLENTFFKFYLGLVYFFAHLILALADLVNVFGDMSLMITNLLQTSIQIMVGVKLVVLRHSKLLKGILEQVECGGNEDRYKNHEEKTLYLSYNAIAKKFFTTGHRVALVTSFFSYCEPIEYIIKAVLRNETIPIVLPYQIHVFADITDIRTYALVYVFQCPMIYYYYFHAFSVFFLLTLIAHVAGDLSILAHRIRQIDCPDSSNVNVEIAFRNVVIEHHKIMRVAEAIDDVFNPVLLEELAITTMLLALTCYKTIEKSVTISWFEFFYVMNYCIALTLLILVYCLGGDFLIRESENIQDAYYESPWFVMKTQFRRFIAICICRTQKPLQLTAGRFYVFSLPRFSDILKMSMAYISMLRNVG